MLKKIIRTLFISPLLLISSLAMGNQQLPDEFTVTERWLSWTTTFDIGTKDGVIGTIHRQPFTLTPEYYLMDMQENVMAKARMRLLTLLPVFDVVDPYQNPLGMVNREFTFFFTTYNILAPNGRTLGQAVLNFWGTTFTVSDPLDGHTIAILSRPFFRLKSNWTVKILDQSAITENNIHPHLFLTLLAFQVDREYWEAERRRQEAERRRQEQQHQDDLDNCDIYCEYSSRKSPKGIDESNVEQSVQEENMLNDYKVKLHSFRQDLENVNPSEEDFKAIESISLESDATVESNEAVDKVQSHFEHLFGLFTSNQLSPQQKAALYLMLDNLIDEQLKELKLEKKKMKNK